MKKIFLSILLCTCLSASDFSHIEFLGFSDSIVEKGNVSTRSKDLQFNSLMKYSIDDFSLQSELVIIKSYDKEPKYNGETDPKIYVRNLTAEYKIDSYSLTGGVLSFVDDCFNDPQTINIDTRNNGISTLVQTTYDGVFLSKKLTEADIIKVGYGFYDKLDVQNEDFMIQENQGSHGLFVLGEHYEPNNRKIEFNLYDINIHYLGSSLGDLLLTGVSWLEVLPEEGIELYSALSYSKINKHIESDVQTQILTHKGIPGYVRMFYPELFDLDDENGEGYSVMLGASKEFDFLRSTKIGVELYHSSQNYMNLVAPQSGKPYNYDNRGNMLRLFSNVDINKHLSVSACGYWFDRQYGTKIGGLLGEVETGTNPVLPDNHKNESAFSTTIRWRF